MIKDYLQADFGYTDYQIEQIRYTVISVLSELSKIGRASCRERVWSRV